MADPRNFSVTTDYPMEKIVFAQEGSVNIATLPNKFSSPYWTVKKLEIAHGMGQPLFIYFKFMFDGDNGWRTGCAAEDCLGYSDSTYLTIMINNITTGTLRYQVFGTWIDDYNAGATPLITTADIKSKMIMNTDLAYRKILFSDTAIIPSSITGVGEIEISHNLSYAPIYQVYFDGLPNEVWQEHSGGVQDKWGISNIGGLPANDSDCFTWATPTKLYIKGHQRNFGSSDIKVWYRIFANG